LRIKGDKRLYWAAALLVLVISCTWEFSLSLKNDLKNLKAQQRELLLLRDEFLSMKGLIDAIEGKGSLTKVEGIIQASDEIFRSLGLRQKVKSVKSIGTKKIKDATEEEVEVQVEKVNMNELVNIFYRIENAPMMLTIKKVTVKTSFENPTLLDMAMTLGLIKAE
jgi:hypothetical protein